MQQLQRKRREYQFRSEFHGDHVPDKLACGAVRTRAYKLTQHVSYARTRCRVKLAWAVLSAVHCVTSDSNVAMYLLRCGRLAGAVQLLRWLT